MEAEIVDLAQWKRTHPPLIVCLNAALAMGLAHRLNVLDLCKMFGWRNPKMAMIYYNPTASDITKRLSARVKL